MFYIQVTLPAVLVILAFTLGHSFVAVDYSGVYFEETEEVIEETVSVETQILDDCTEVQLDEDGLPLLPDKYNYLKIENVFQGRLSDTDELFSFEIALATYQTNVTADFFIKGLSDDLSIIQMSLKQRLLKNIYLKVTLLYTDYINTDNYNNLSTNAFIEYKW